jgi:hypothetical protein
MLNAASINVAAESLQPWAFRRTGPGDDYSNFFQGPLKSNVKAMCSGFEDGVLSMEGWHGPTRGQKCPGQARRDVGNADVPW